MMAWAFDFGLKNIVLSIMFSLYAIAMLFTGIVYLRIKKKNPGYPKKMYFVGSLCFLLALTNIGLAAAIFIDRNETSKLI